MERSILSQQQHAQLINENQFQGWYYPKLLSMLALTLLDLGINSSLDYDNFKSSLSSSSATAATATTATKLDETKTTATTTTTNSTSNDTQTKDQPRSVNHHYDENNNNNNNNNDDNKNTDDYYYITNNNHHHRNELKNIHVLIFGFQFLCQISTFSTWFLLICDTFPFQVGLLGILAEEYLFLLLLHVLYLVLTCVVGGFRLAELHEHYKAYELWMLPHYAILSSIHKLVAPLYYAINLRSSIKLGKTRYFTQEAWVKLATKDISNSFHCDDERT